MAYYTAGDSWVEVVAAGSGIDDNFLLENVGQQTAILSFAATTPDAGSRGMTCRGGDREVRAGVTGKLWIRSARLGTTVKVVCFGAS